MADAKLATGKRAAIPRARARFLTQSLQLEEKELPGVASVGILLSTAFIAGIIGWAYVTPVVEVAHTVGEVVPAGRTHQVQHLEGGVVEHILVGNGDRVEADQVLVELRTYAASSEVAQIESRRGALEAKLRRTESLLDGVGIREFTALSSMDSRQVELFREQQSSYMEQLALLDTQRRQREQEVISKRAQAAALQDEVNILEERTRLHDLADSVAAIPRVELLDARARLARAIGELRDVEAEIRMAREGVRESQQKKIEFISRWREERRLETEETENQLAEVNEELSRFDDKLVQLRIVAPVAGIVQGMQVNTLNQVIEPGQVILEIVPVDGDLVAETRVLPRDVGHVVSGQRVTVKVSSYESQRFGTIDGSLRYVSATTYLDEDRLPYYRAEILLAKNYVGDNPSRDTLVPGMTVEADIRTGEKSVLDYILKPVYRGFSGALQER